MLNPTNGILHKNPKNEETAEWSYPYPLKKGEVRDHNIIDSFDRKSAAINYDYTAYMAIEDPLIKQSIEKQFTQDQKDVLALWNKRTAELAAEFVNTAMDFNRKITIQNKLNVTRDEFLDFIKNTDEVLEKRMAIFMKKYGGQKIYSFLADEFNEKIQFSEEFKQRVNIEETHFNFSNVEYLQNWTKNENCYSCEIKITISVLAFPSGWLLLDPSNQTLKFIELESDKIKNRDGKITYLEKEPQPLITIGMQVELTTIDKYLLLTMRQLEFFSYTNDLIHKAIAENKPQHSFTL